MEGIFETSPQGQPLTVNPALARTLGYDSSGEFISKIRDLGGQLYADPDKRAEFVELIEKQDVVLGFECELLRRDGAKTWVSISSRRVCGPDGKTLYYSGFMEDITERKQAEEALAERLRFERLISDLSTSFVNPSIDKVDSEINKGLRSITEFFDADRCSIGLFSEGGTQLALAFEYHSAEAEPAPEFLSKEQMPWYMEQLIRGNPVVISRVGDFPPEAQNERRLCLAKGMKSLLSLPLRSGEKTLGSCALVSVRAERVWSEHLLQRFRLVCELFANVLERKQMEGQLQARLREVEDLRKQLEKDNIYLREEVRLLYPHKEIVGQSKPIRQVLTLVEKVARTDSTVLITGETGTGKELFAQAIHSLSNRSGRLMVKVNCAALPPTLIESELFGREKGAYTGALTRQIGRFELANGSTLSWMK